MSDYYTVADCLVNGETQHTIKRNGKSCFKNSGAKRGWCKTCKKRRMVMPNNDGKNICAACKVLEDLCRY